MNIHATAWPDSVEIPRGDTGFISVAISNTSTVIDAYEVQVFGLDPEWVDISPKRLSLFPGDTENVDIRVTLPIDYPSSRRVLAVNVVSQDDPGSFTLSEVELSIPPHTITSIALDPVMVTGGRRGTFGIVVSNRGNAVVRATAFAVDPEDLAEFRFDPPTVVVAPGRDQVIELTASGGRAWFGQAKARTFTVGVDAETRIETIATFIQKPRIGRWLISLLGLLTAAAVFAVVLSRTFDNVVDEASVDDALIDDALADGGDDVLLIPTDPGAMTGTITSSTTGEGLSGVQAELFEADDPLDPIATAATSDDGAFSFPVLGAGDYKVRLSGAGIETIWYPGVDTPDDAETIEVLLDTLKQLDPVVLGGIPVDVSGTIATDDPGSVTVSLVAAGVTDPEANAVVAQAQVGPDGSFSLPDIPSPGTYQIVVEQPGAEVTVRNVVLVPGEDLAGVEMAPQAGNGSITGTITGPDGPLGGVRVTATAGSVEVDTVTLTEGEVGTFTLRNLGTPAQYTVTLGRDGFTTEARTVALSDEQRSGTVTASLVPAAGSISGSATVDGEAERGLTVTITGGDVDRTKPIVSQGASAGGFVFEALPAPGTYTLTFSGNDVLPQVQVVDLDPRAGRVAVDGVAVSLSRTTTAVRGIVRDSNGDPVPRATVNLTDGASTFEFLTADEPSGQFEFGAVPPGSYTLSASRTGTEPAVVIVSITASQAPPFLDLTLGDQASLSGTVVDTQGNAVTEARTVRLFDPNRFPNAGELATTVTDAAGNYSFPGLDAPESFVVAVYASDTAADPVDSVVIRTIPSTELPVPDLLGETPPDAGQETP